VSFVTACFVGLGMVAVWCHVRFPGLRPGTIVMAISHVVLSFALFSLTPLVLALAKEALPAPLCFVVFLVGVLVPSLTYVFLSWIWLIARIYELADRPPRGGHPAENAA